MEDLNRIVRAVLGNLNPGLSSQIHVQLGELPAVFVDTDDITRVLQNIFINASEAIPPDGIITITSSHRDGAVELSVEDNGTGNDQGVYGKRALSSIPHLQA